MSTVVMSACWPLQMDVSAKAVLMSLADNANDSGHCWPSIDTIAKRTCLHRSNVIKAIERLETMKHVSVDRTNGRHSTYTVTPNLDLFAANQSRSTTRRGALPVAEHDPSRSARTGSGALPDPSRSATGPVAERDSNRKEPKGTVIKSNRKGARADAHACPEDVCETVWTDWLALRKAKHAPISETVISRARAESGKAGMPFEEFLAEWCERGSQGLKAEWITRRDGARGPPKPSIAQQFSEKTYTGTPDDELPAYLQTPRSDQAELPEARRV